MGRPTSRCECGNERPANRKNGCDACRELEDRRKYNWHVRPVDGYHPWRGGPNVLNLGNGQSFRYANNTNTKHRGDDDNIVTPNFSDEIPEWVE